ncbi:MAG: hypothetical protein JXN65_00690 [Clostridia bacterium]|nr:hypothetical protein [Clostridia bacterium]
MKRNMYTVALVSILVAVLALSGCSAIKATNQAKDMLDEYFTLWNDEKIDDCVDMFSDDIIDENDDKETTELIFNSRRAMLGEVEKFKVSSFDSNGNLKETQVVLTANVKYANLDEEIEEVYNFISSNGEMLIVGIKFADITDEILVPFIDDFYSDFDNMDHADQFYIPYIQKKYPDNAGMQKIADYAKETGGEYVECEITDLYYYYEEKDWGKDIYVVAEVEATLKFEDEEFFLSGQLCVEDGELGFNFLSYYPKAAYEVIEEYYANILAEDSDAVMSMYSPTFFKYSDFSEAEWKETVVDQLVFGFGNLADHELGSWEYGLIDIDGVDTPVYSIRAVSYYDDGIVDEYITLVKGESGDAVVGHQLELR